MRARRIREAVGRTISGDEGSPQRAGYRRSADADARRLAEAAGTLRSFDRPALVVRAAGDRVMPPGHGRRLAALLPQGRPAEIAESRTLVPLDQPERLALAIRESVPARRR
ncbi:alpha/beta fold hydrolase [Streptomyces laculatispora]|uniref:alpha/beta fold hydrolase n=1 Tax=Streptomyces laculatispora TaxID=887464 RepID=UPI003517DF1A